MSRERGGPFWGWHLPARRLVAGLGLPLALALAWAGRPAPGRPAPPPRLLVDPNTAPPQVLTALPRLGPVLAGRLVDARAEAPFRSLDDLDRRVKGIGPATATALRPFLRFPPEPGPPQAPEGTTPPLASRGGGG